MGWNGSNQSKTVANGPGGQSPAAKSDNLGLTYFITFTVVVAVAAAAYFALRGGRGGQSPGEQPEPSRGKIAEVVPAAAPRAEVSTNNAPPSLPLNVKRDHSELTREELLTKVPHWAYSVEDRKRVDPGYEKKHERFLRTRRRTRGRHTPTTCWQCSCSATAILASCRGSCPRSRIRS